MTVVDTVFNEQMRPVFVDEPATVRRWLKARNAEDTLKICKGETREIVSVSEYLYEEKFTDVLGILRELLRKQSLPMFQRNPKRLEIYIESSARRIIESVLGEK